MHNNKSGCTLDSVLCFGVRDQGEDGDDAKVVDLLECYQQSEQYRTVQKQLQPLLDGLFRREQAGGTIRNQKKAITYATNFFWQVISSTTIEFLISCIYTLLTL